MHPAILFASLALAASLATAQGVCGPHGCPITPPGSESPLPLLVGPVAEASRAVVRITHRAGRGASLGSGTLVATDASSSYIVTCAHLFDDGPGATSVGNLPAEVVALDRPHDLALLRTPRVEGRPAVVGDDPTSRDQTVGELTVCGFGPAGVFRAVRGPITGRSIAAGATSPSLRMRGAVRPGDSGGGVFDSRGMLVAVVWGARHGETYAMCGEPLRRVLGRVPAPQPAAPSPLVPVDRPQPPPVADDAWRLEVQRRLDSLARKDDVAGMAEGWRSAIARLDERLTQIAPRVAATAPARAGGVITGEMLAAVGIGGPIGLGIVTLGWMLRRRAALQGAATRTIAIESPPLPQRTVPETHYVPYERDEFARAHQWASEQLARKFPGSIEWLAGLESLIKQKINGG
jgi:hypothetical protein